MLVLGDAHADDPEKREALFAAYEAGSEARPQGAPRKDERGGTTRESETRALQVGDLLHYDLPQPTWFVAGNNEAFDVIDALRRGEHPDGVENAHLLASTVATVEDIDVAGLSGNHAPTKYDCDRAELEGDRRRHFTHEDVERALDLGNVDVFLTHEAPHGLISYGYDPGCEHVDAILEALEPELCLVGHHHRHAESTFGQTRVVSLAPVWEAYYTLDAETLELERHELPR